MFFDGSNVFSMDREAVEQASENETETSEKLAKEQRVQERNFLQQLNSDELNKQ